MTSGAAVDGFFPPDSVNAAKLIDDTEATNWAGRSPAARVDVTNPFVNVNLAGNNPQMVRSVNVSALLRPINPEGDEDPEQPDDESGSRFTALRKFAIDTCTESMTSDCSSLLPAGAPLSPYTRIYTSPDDAFDATAPRPLAPDLIFQKFDVPDTAATHVRLVALENQCTGTPEYAGDQDNDPLSVTDCIAGSTRDESVRASELQVFEFDRSTLPPNDPVVVMTMTGPATAEQSAKVGYEFSYTNLGPQPSVDAMIEYVLPAGVTFVSATDGGTYKAATRTVRWDRETVAVNVTDGVSVTVRMPAAAGAVVSTAQFSGDLTHSAPAGAVTVVLEE